MSDIRETLETSERMLCKGISEINEKGELNNANLQILGQAVDALKDIYSIKEKMESGSYERYMSEGYGRRMRDSRGRYMDDGYSREYSRYESDYGTNYGHGNEEEREFLRWKMQNASSEQEREKIRRKLEQM